MYVSVKQLNKCMNIIILKTMIIIRNKTDGRHEIVVGSEIYEIGL